MMRLQSTIQKRISTVSSARRHFNNIHNEKVFFFFIFFLLPLFYLAKRDVTFHAVIPHGNHTKVFDYLSDVTSFRVLNPTIVRITHWEHVDEWNFHVEYTECLSQVPAVWNHARARYEIRHDFDGSHGLISQHLTCFFYNYFCLTTNSSLQITQLSRKEVGYKEKIFYSCPFLLLSFCFNEIIYQRRLITANLQKIFSALETVSVKPKLINKQIQ